MELGAGARELIWGGKQVSMAKVCDSQTLHTPYYPQSSGKVERLNGIIKNRLAKLREDR